VSGLELDLPRTNDLAYFVAASAAKKKKCVSGFCFKRATKRLLVFMLKKVSFVLAIDLKEYI
jgi:hypothetical protein